MDGQRCLLASRLGAIAVRDWWLNGAPQSEGLQEEQVRESIGAWEFGILCFQYMRERENGAVSCIARSRSIGA